MNSFSLRRTLLFCRLQAFEIFGGKIWRKIKIMLSTALFIVLIGMLVSKGNVTDSTDPISSMILMLSAVMFIPVVLADLISYRLTTPVSMMEKYVSTYILTFGAGAIFLVTQGLICSIMLSIITLFTDSHAEGPVLLFTGKDFSILNILTVFMFMTLIIYFALLGRQKRKYSKTAYWTTLLIFLAGFCLWVFCKKSDMIDEKTGDYLAGSISLIMLISSMILAYRLLRKAELDTKDDD